MYKHPRIYFRKVLKFNNSFGFSITDVMTTLAIVVIVATLATPNLKMLMKGYKLRSASNDLTAFIQRTKIRAAKTNETWTINFNPSGYVGYEIKDGSGNTVSSINFGICAENLTLFERCYDGDIQYKYPESGPNPYDNEILTFYPTGITSEGYVSISNIPDTRYYRVRIVSTSGIVRTERWNGLAWE